MFAALIPFIFIFVFVLGVFATYFTYKVAGIIAAVFVGLLALGAIGWYIYETFVRGTNWSRRRQERRIGITQESVVVKETLGKNQLLIDPHGGGHGHP